MLAGTTFQEVLVLLGVTRNICDAHKRSFFCFKQQSIPSVFMGQPFPPPESAQIAAVRRVDPIIILSDTPVINLGACSS